MKPTFFLMIISGRSGSSYLRELVNQDEHILMLGEMLAGKNVSQQKEIAQNFFRGKVSNNNYLEDRTVLGFKTKLSDVKDISWFVSLIKHHNPILIVNRRKNYLKQAISRERMLVLLNNTREKYGEAHHSPKHQDDIVKSIKVNVDSIYKFTRDFEQRDKTIAEFCDILNCKITTLYYEDFASNPTVAINILSKKLGIKVNVKDYNITYKNTSNDLKKAIINYDELEAKIKETKYYSMLEE